MPPAGCWLNRPFHRVRLFRDFLGDPDQDIEHSAGQHLRDFVRAQAALNILHGELVEGSTQVRPSLDLFAELLRQVRQGIGRLQIALRRIGDEMADIFIEQGEQDGCQVADESVEGGSLDGRRLL
jgi:hypothetical protein